LVLGIATIVLVFIAGCISYTDEKESNFNIPFPSFSPTTVTQSIVVTSTITQTKQYIVAFTVQRLENYIVITYQGGPDAIMLSYIEYGINTADHEWKAPKIGDRVTFPGRISGKDHAIVVGTFTDGVKQVLLDTYV
jgi:hypothetical protein